MVLLAATASSGLPISYTVSSGSARISGNTVNFTTKGTVRLTATQPGNFMFAAKSVSINVEVK